MNNTIFYTFQYPLFQDLERNRAHIPIQWNVHSAHTIYLVPRKTVKLIHTIKEKLARRTVVNRVEPRTKLAVWNFYFFYRSDNALSLHQ